MVVSDPHLFLEVAHFASPALASRLVYVSDPEASVRYIGNDTAERALRGLRHWADIHVEDYRPFLAAHQRFLVYGTFRWLKDALEKDAARLEVAGRNYRIPLFAVRKAGD